MKKAIDPVKYFYSHRLSAGEYTRNTRQWLPLVKGTQWLGNKNGREISPYHLFKSFESCKYVINIL